MYLKFVGVFTTAKKPTKITLESPTSICIDDNTVFEFISDEPEFEFDLSCPSQVIQHACKKKGELYITVLYHYTSDEKSIWEEPGNLKYSNYMKFVKKGEIKINAEI